MIKLYSVTQVSKMTEIHKNRIYEAIAADDLKCFKVGKKGSIIRISEEQLMDWLNGGRS